MAENNNMDDLFTCNVCLEKFNDGDRKPKLLVECHHTFCQRCLEEMYNRQEKKTIVCPMCSAVSKPGKAGISALKNNHYLTQFSDILKQVSSPPPKPQSLAKILSEEKVQAVPYLVSSLQSLPDQKCPKHGPTWDDVFYCQTCDILVCRKCVEQDHAGRNHTIVSIDEAKDDFKLCISTSLEHVKSSLENMQSDLQKLLASFSSRAKKTNNAIIQAYSGIQNSLNFLVDDLDTETDNEIRRMSESKLDTLEEILNIKNQVDKLVISVVNGNKLVKEHVAEAYELVNDDVVVSFVKPNTSVKMVYCPYCKFKLVVNPSIVGASNHAVREYRCSNCLAIINHFTKR